MTPTPLIFESDCGAALAASDMNTDASAQANVDMERLRHIYEAHRTSFWGVIAAEYGQGASPLLLEETWKRGIATNAPLTPCISPDTHTVHSGSYQGYHTKPMHQLPTPVQETKSNATSISALLGIVSFAACLIQLSTQTDANKSLGCQSTQPKGKGVD